MSKEMTKEEYTLKRAELKRAANERYNVQGNVMFTGGGPPPPEDGITICPGCHAQNTCRHADMNTKMVCSKCSKSFPRGEFYRVQGDLRKAAGFYMPEHALIHGVFPETLGLCSVCREIDWSTPEYPEKRIMQVRCGRCKSTMRWFLPDPFFHEMEPVFFEKASLCLVCRSGTFRPVKKSGYHALECATCNHTYGYKLFSRKDVLNLLKD
jgi:hypothetical protein